MRACAGMTDTGVAGLLFGLSLACGSTVVLTKPLAEHRLLATERGRLAVGWLIVQDSVMVVVLVPLPALGHTPDSPATFNELALGLGLTLAKVGAFVAIMLVVGRKLVPMILHYTAHTGSRELFRLAVANLGVARRLFVTIPQAFEAGQVVQQARIANPSLEIVARAHTDDEVDHLTGLGADPTVMGEREIAHRMIERAFRQEDAEAAGGA